MKKLLLIPLLCLGLSACMSMEEFCKDNPNDERCKSEGSPAQSNPSLTPPSKAN